MNSVRITFEGQLWSGARRAPGRTDRSARLLHLINHSGHFGASYVAPIPIRDLEVELPTEGEPSGVAGLVAGRSYAWSANDGRLSISVPELGLFEAMRIELG